MSYRGSGDYRGSGYGGDRRGGGGGDRYFDDHSRGRERERYGSGSGGGGGGYQRDRSRDGRRDGGGGYGGGGGGGRGFQGRGGGGRGGGRGGGNRYSAPRPAPNEPYKVLTNFFKVLCNLSSNGGSWMVYHADIIDAVRRKKVGPDGSVLEPWEFHVVPKLRSGVEKALDLEKGGNAVSRRALGALYDKLQAEDQSIIFAFDGGNKIVAPKQLFTETKKISSEGAGDWVMVRSDAGKYGPASAPPAGGGEGGNGPGGGRDDPAPEGALERHYEVRILADTDADAPDAERAKYEWKIVKLKEVEVISYDTIRQIFNGQLARATGEQEYLQQVLQQIQVVKQCIDIVYKNAALFSGMKLLGRSDRLFYFPEAAQQGFRNSGLLSREVLRNCTNPQAQAIYAGLKTAIQINRRGGVYFVADSDIDFVDLNRTPRGDPRGDPIYILDERTSSIAGISINNLNQRITDPRVRADVQKALERLTLHVAYTKERGCNWENRMRARGKSNDWIQEKRTDVRHNKRAKEIKWACNDPNEYSFTVPGQAQGQDQPPALVEGEEAAADVPPPPLPPVTHTVASYFYENYGIRLRYPNMPLIKIGRVKTRNGFVDEWFPIEFLSQEFGKSRDADNQKLTAALRYNDERTGRQSVDRITEMVRIANSLEKNGLTLSDFLGRFGMHIDVEPEAFEGKVESEPELHFSEANPAQVNNGDWRLADQRRIAQVFARPAKFYSFAFVSMVDERTTERYFAQLFKRLDAHGLENESGVPVFDGDSPSRALRTLIKYSGDRDRNEVEEGVTRAIQHAKQFFLYDVESYFSHHKIWFKTLYRQDSGLVTEALVMPPGNGAADGFGVILPVDVRPPTHQVTNPQDGKNYDVRLTVQVRDRGYFDPFDYRFDTKRCCHQVKVNNRWEDAGFRSSDAENYVRFVYSLQDGTKLKDGDFRGDPKPLIVADEGDLECPSIVFSLTRDDDKSNYGVVKYVTNAEFGVPNQNAVASKFSKQRSPDQYLSNLAIKINEKLASSVFGETRAWTTSFDDRPGSGLPWVSEVPTLVIGVTTSSGIGQNALSIISGSVGLDPGLMQMGQDIRTQDKSELIHPSVLKAIVKTLTIHFYQHNRVKPERLLFIRDGLSEGNLSRIHNHEMSCIRSALVEFFRETRSEFSCQNETCGYGKHGCIHCTLPITYLLCQSQHNIKVVPADERNSVKNNVHSGTVLSGEQLQILSGTGLNASSFLLTAQGGLKGTSKPVLYRTLLNENEYHRPSNQAATPLTREKLERLVYHMSFQYTTATKAVRLPPVIGYSKKSADIMMMYINYQRESSRLVTYNPPAPEEEDEVEADDAGRENFLCLSEMAEELENVGGNLPAECLGQLQPKFGPLGRNGVRTNPFRHHANA